MGNVLDLYRARGEPTYKFFNLLLSYFASFVKLMLLQ